MILTGERIRSERRRGNLTIDPFEEDALNPNSYNYRLAPLLKMAPRQTLDFGDARRDWNTCLIPESGLVLSPDCLYLGHTIERIGSDIYAMSLIGRSSIGRLGLFVQISADLGHQGSELSWTLELHAIQPTRVYPGMRLGQVSFWTTDGMPTRYAGTYDSATVPLESRGLDSAR